MKFKIYALLSFAVCIFQLSAQNISELLGSPTTNSIIISVLADSDLEVYWEYGTKPGEFSATTQKIELKKDIPVEYQFDKLLPDLRYFYHLRYRNTGSGNQFLTGPEHSFQTARPKGSTFTFALEADPHLDANSIPESYSLTLQNVAAKKPDFILDLGDSFMCEKQTIKNQEVFTQRHLLLRSYFDKICHSIPLYLIIGNHEGEMGWSLNGTATSNPVLITNTRKLYYPNPVPDEFYSGNSKEEPFVGLRENYYAFEWGDALFVVLDPYWYSPNKGDWNWTLGTDQYNWFKKTLTESSSKFKFVFCHTLVGGNTSDARGGTEFAHLFEMGGYNTDGSYGFDKNRPGWQKPIHTLMKENGVTAFFHGHDHFFGKQEKDGIIYQVVPQPSNRSLTNISATEYGYVNGVFMPGRGFLNITVSPDDVKIDYIKTYLPSEESAGHKNGEVAYSYSVKSGVTGIGQYISEPSSDDFNQNSPNPFSSDTSIHYRINKTEQVDLKIFNIYGKEVATLVSGIQEPGNYGVYFDPVRLNLPCGIYLGRFSTDGFQKSFKMIYTKN